MDTLPLDLHRLIYGYAGDFTPWRSLKLLSDKALNCHWRMNRQVIRTWGPWKWTPSNCNYLRWYWINDRCMTHPYWMYHPLAGLAAGPRRIKRPRKGFFLGYHAITGLTPTKKRMVTLIREKEGFHPIFPGNLQYPTTRVSHDPFCINDKYYLG